MTRMFLDKLEKPDDMKLAKALGTSYKLWQQIQKKLKGQYPGLKPEWKYYGAKSGWTMKMMLKKRNLFFFGPCNKYFRIGFVFGEKVVKDFEDRNLSPVLI